MSKIKSLLLASSVCIATVCINFPAHATERHLLEQTVSYEELGNVLRLPAKLGGPIPPIPTGNPGKRKQPPK